MTEPDEVLVRRFNEGDREAFGLLVERHERRVYNLAFRMLGKEEDARDATQDAFVAALRKLGGFRGEARFTTWMHRVTVNACYDLLRKQARQPMLRLVGEEDEHAPEPGLPVEDHGDEVAGTTDVERALAEVPIEFRAVLVLHDLQDVAYDEIARILDVPVGTVKSRLHRGRIALAKAMGLSPAGEHGDPARASERKS
ncbi:MAG TPA: sigma-70 family RNA polymerase sigma factor [Actinomycetota bacterium]